VVSGKHPTDSQRVDAAVTNHRRRLRSFPVGGRRRVHLKRYWLTGSPKLFSRSGVESEQRFFFPLAGENKNLAAGHDGRSMSQPDGDLPFLFQSLGPLRRKPWSAAVAIGPAPL